MIILPRLSAAILAAAAALLAVAFTPAPARAQQAASNAVASFYDGKQIGVLLGGVGGEFDLNVRLMSRFFPRHMPGAPHIVPQYLTGAGGLRRAASLMAPAR